MSRSGTQTRFRHFTARIGTCACRTSGGLPRLNYRLLKWLRIASKIGYNGEMASITVKNIEQETLDGLAAKAALEGVSVQQYTRDILRRFAQVLTTSEILARQKAARENPPTEEELTRQEAAWAKVRQAPKAW